MSDSVSKAKPQTGRASIFFRLLRAAIVFVLGAVTVFALGDVMYSSTLGDLRPWHTARLEQEFDASQAVKGYDFASYREQERRLFDEVRSLSRDGFDAQLDAPVSRFSSDGGPYRQRVPGDWNRSYVLQAQQQRGVALLVHGLSDSPYSLRPIAQVMHEAGITVYGLRLPGHGTIPAGLDSAEWKDWLAAVRLTVESIRKDHPDAPFWYVGYSTGATLGLKHSVEAINTGRKDLLPNRLFLLSPALGVTPLAPLANLQRIISRWGVAQKARWSNIDLELDPYKYASFAKNAGAQIGWLCRALDHDLSRMARDGSIEQLPPVTTFQSLVDATVRVQDLAGGLYGRLKHQGGDGDRSSESELVLFDLNRSAGIEPLLSFSPKAISDAFAKAPRRDFRLIMVGNVDGTDSIAASVLERGQSEPVVKPLPYVWPEGVYSLSHMALPFPLDDPIYGLRAAKFPDRLPSLGQFVLRGERGAIAMAPADQLRMKSNPFFDLMKAHVLEAVGRARPQ